jgi:DnaJ-class molecular chaperone
MNDVTGTELGRIPEGTKWCPHCNGYGSSLREAGARCSHCGGSGLVWSDHERPVASGNGEPVPRE